MSDRPKRDAKGKANKRHKETSRSTRENSRTRGHSGRSHRRGSRQHQSTHDPAAAGVMTVNSHGDSAPTNHVAAAQDPTLAASTEFDSPMPFTGRSTYGASVPATSPPDHSLVGLQQAHGSEADTAMALQGASPQEHPTRRPYHVDLTEFGSPGGNEEEEDDHLTVETISSPNELLRRQIADEVMELDRLFDKWRR